MDWYHANEYIWQAASAIWGQAGEERARWAQAQLDLLWESQVGEVMDELERWQTCGEAVAAALSYYREHQQRMDYASYRARGLQIGSGSAESACKQLVTARLKQAGMIWDAAGAEAVAAVRAWLKSARWAEAMALRGGYRRRQVEAPSAQEQGQGGGVAEQVAEPDTTAASERPALAAEVLAQVQAELAAQRGKNGWGKAWSVKRQREVAAQRMQARPISTA
ncbi:MAG: hypothetical protein IPO81_13760 [Kouleothrix sp.]|nr:hypothetical protein [Kouleothrix sp.]